MSVTLERMTGERWTLGHRSALDGIRGIAVLLVLAYHVKTPGFSGGGPVGVSLFFGLSGFLITALLMNERDRTGTIRLRAFYVRRARRLLPALVASTAAVVAVSPLMPSWWFQWNELPAVALYVGNFVQASRGDLGALAGTWSLAIEEQFYLVWPVLLLLALRWGRRAVIAVAIAGVATSLTVRGMLIAGLAPWERIYFGSDTASLNLLMGAGLAAWLSGRRRHRGSSLVCATGFFLLLAAAALPVLLAFKLSQPVVAFASALLIWGAVGLSSEGLLEAGWLTWLGRRSYGLYLWHVPLTVLLSRHLGWGWPALTVTLIPVSLLLAEASYRWVEMPLRSGASPKLRDVPVGVGVHRVTV